jgi:MFS family permease
VVTQDWLLAAVIPLLLVAQAAALIGLIVAATELLTPTTNSIVAGHRVRMTPDRLRGRVQAAATTVTMSLGWAGPLLAGVLFQQVGPTATVLAATGYAVLLASAATIAPALRQAPWLSVPNINQTP